MASNTAKTEAIRKRKRCKNKANFKAAQKRMRDNLEILARLSEQKNN